MYKSPTRSTRLGIVTKNTNIVKLNGRHYDSETGDLLNIPHDPEKPSPTIREVKSVASTKQKPKSVQLKRDIKPSDELEKKVAHDEPAKRSSGGINDVSRHPMATIIHHKTESSTTLMRQSVQKPKPGYPNHLKAHGHVKATTVPQSHFIAPKLSAEQIDDNRLKHAHGVRHSRLITHYSYSDTPLTPDRPQMISLPRAVVPRPAMRAPVRSRSTADMLERAVARATTHEQPPYRPSRGRYGRHTRRIVGVGSVVVLFVVLTGFLIHANMSNIKVDLASSKAGFSAGLPTAALGSYNLASVGSSVRQVSLEYNQPNNLSGSYEIIERPSAWDSATLRDMFVTQVTKYYQTEDDGGRIVYLYGQGNATWVNGGVWYTITSGGNLTDTDLLQIAASF